MSFDCHLKFTLEYPKSLQNPNENYREPYKNYKMSCDKAINLFKNMESNPGNDYKISGYQITKSNGYSQITASSSKTKTLPQVRKDIDAFQKIELLFDNGKLHFSDDGFGP